MNLFFAVEKLDIGDIFEPDMEDNMTTNSHHTFPTNTHNPVKRERTISETSVKLAKVEEMTGFEKLRDGRSSIKMPKTEPMGGPGGHPGHHHHPQAHGQQQPTKSMVVSIPLPSSTSTGLHVNMFFFKHFVLPFALSFYLQEALSCTYNLVHSVLEQS
jgi:hypothetical protein